MMNGGLSNTSLSDPTANQAIANAMKEDKAMERNLFAKYDKDLTLNGAFSKVMKKFNVSRSEARKIMFEKIPEESKFQANIKKKLKIRYPEAYIKKITQGNYSEGGIPDILCIFEGHYFGFEVKRPFIGGDGTDLQKINIKQIEKAGGIAAIVSYPEQAIEIIEKWRSEHGSGRIEKKRNINIPAGADQKIRRPEKET